MPIATENRITEVEEITVGDEDLASCQSAGLTIVWGIHGCV